MKHWMEKDIQNNLDEPNARLMISEAWRNFVRRSSLRHNEQNVISGKKKNLRVK